MNELLIERTWYWLVVLIISGGGDGNGNGDGDGDGVDVDIDVDDGGDVDAYFKKSSCSIFAALLSASSALTNTSSTTSLKRSGGIAQL